VKHTVEAVGNMTTSASASVDPLRIVLAPMEGLTDFTMRHVLTQLSPYDWCVTEFLRITDRLLPDSVFYRHCPELLSQGRTSTGTPVHFQLLGSDPQMLALNAQRAVALGAPAIDLNFGCPAKTVNRHGGGATLLANSQTLHDIVRCVREHVPKGVPVSAKMRLGIDSTAELMDNAHAIYDAGADWLTIHARTKSQGYRPPVDWAAIGRVTSQYPQWRVIANGDIDSPESLVQCQALTGCTDFMVGRAAVCEPDLVGRLKHAAQEVMPWSVVHRWQLHFLQKMAGTENGLVGRYKQWLAMTTSVYPEALVQFQRVKTQKRIADIVALSEEASGWS